ncbi:MAG TPA: right-handed parallel beta-helix repeat-containing protein, partial [Pseudomonas sp.]|nr:right-handed parallel beta-helix repeat-containing protein [Pseudomonas sp.]
MTSMTPTSSVHRQTLPLLAGVLLLASAWAQATSQAPKATQELRAAKSYNVTSAAVEPLHLDPPKLPDLSGYTAAAVQAKLVTRPGGSVTVRRMLQQDALKDFIGGNNRMAEWVTRQRGMPQAIFVEGGYLTLGQLARQLPKEYFEETAPGVYLARLPIVVAQGATLHIDKTTRELRLSEERGAFLVNDGKLFVTDTRIVAWREADNGPATFRKAEQFRPFLLSWGGTETYIVNSTLISFGYETSKS